jgi:O-antigen/teichoic acid export membrane protein
VKPFDETGAFRPPAGGEGIRRLALRSAGVTVLSQGAGFGVQMVATVVLARLLTPEDFGLVAMVTTFSLLLMNFGLSGFTEAVLQRPDIDHALASNLFWINAGVGLALTIAFAAAAPVLAWLYGDARLAAVAVAIALTIFFTSISVQHLALLMRAMRFSEVSANAIIARIVSVAVSILLAWRGWGYWALVAGAVALPVTTSAAAWIRCRWVPGLPQRGAGTRSVLRFATYTYGCFSVGYVMRNMDNLLIGWSFGPQALGFYKRAFDLFVLPVELATPLTRVAVSALNRLTPDARQRGQYLVAVLAPIAFIGMGLGVGLTLVGDDVILLLLGPAWTESGRIFTLLAPGIGIMLLYLVQGWIHFSLGRADRLFRWGLVEFAGTALLFVLALAWGPAGIAVAWVVYLSVFTLPALWYAGRPAGLTISSVIAAVWKYVVGSVLAGGATAVIVRALPWVTAAPGPMAALARVAGVSLVFAALYVAAVILLHRGCDPVRHVARLLRDMGAPAPQQAVSSK